jgi:iron complex outermembrane receptor protein
VYLKSSVVKNYHTPTLNDLYFQPGGNPDLKNENGHTIDLGLEFQTNSKRGMIKGEVTMYKSDIKNWIIWLPNFKGYWIPSNVKRVKVKGLELKLTTKRTFKNGYVYFNANWAKTMSHNHGDPVNWADRSIGKQLVYIPEYSSGLLAKIAYKRFCFAYKYNYYSERFTTSNNEKSINRDRLPAYYMNNISLSGKFDKLEIKFSLNNILDEDYISVLKRPMPGRNFTLTLNYKI